MAIVRHSCREVGRLCRPSVRSSLALPQAWAQIKRQQSGTAASQPSAAAQYDSVQDYEDVMTAGGHATAMSGSRKSVPWRPIPQAKQRQTNRTRRNNEKAQSPQSTQPAETTQEGPRTTVFARGRGHYISTLPDTEKFTHRSEPMVPKVIDGILGLETGHAYEPGKRNFAPLPGRWLRDLCSCKSCRNPDTAQRQINVFRNPSAAHILKTDLSKWPEQLSVTFADGHVATLPGSSILDRTARRKQHDRAGITKVHTWDSSIENDPPIISSGDSSGMSTLMLKIRQYGFCFIDDIPPTPEASQALLEMIGPIRNTHYGGFYDFTSDLSSKDTAYTSEALEPHTDNTYFTEPAGLQALHLLSHTDGSGGESSLVDGFAAADKLRQEDPEAYLTLSTTDVYAHASGNEGISIQPSEPQPTLKHSNETQRLMQVRWNTADRAGIATSWHKIVAWYDAAAKFDAILNDQRNQYWFQLKPGRMLIFDNWRCLHGRAAFTGKRRMCGGYINRDDFISRYRATNLSPEEIAGSTVTG